MLVSKIVQFAIFIIVIVILGNLNFTHVTRYRTFLIISILYNIFMGYLSYIVIIMLRVCFTTTIPEEKVQFLLIPKVDVTTNYFIGLVAMIIYLFALPIINIYICESNKFNKKIYLQINSIALLAGIIICLIVSI